MTKKKFLIIILTVSFLIIFFVLPTKIIFSDILLGYADNFIYQTLNKSKTSSLYVNSLQECSQIGGKWEKLGMLQKEQCQIYSKDANKPCFAGFQCDLGSCEASINSGPLALGKCSSVLRRYGCSTEIHFGIAGTSICVD